MGISEIIYRKIERDFQKSVPKTDVLKNAEYLPIVKDENANLTFAVWADPQISCISSKRSLRVFSAVNDIKNANSLDALILCGDITEYGTKAEYEFTKNLLCKICDGVQNIYAVPGNHDVRLRPYKKQLKRFQNFVKSIKNGDIDFSDGYYYVRDLNGYRFIMMGTDKVTLEAAYISDRQLKRLENDILSAPEDKPVFVFNHQTLKRTNGLPVTFLGKGAWRGSVGRESEKLKKVLSVRKNVFFITGHLHYCTSKYTFEDLGNIKALSVPTVGVINHGKFDKFTQGYIISVYDDKVILRSRVFGEGKYVDDIIPNANITVNL